VEHLDKVILVEKKEHINQGQVVMELLLLEEEVERYYSRWTKVDTNGAIIQVGLVELVLYKFYYWITCSLCWWRRWWC
jgi:hypothetical protein